MKKRSRLLPGHGHRLARPGGEILEYALIAGLIVVALIAVVTAVGGKLIQRWNEEERYKQPLVLPATAPSAL